MPLKFALVNRELTVKGEKKKLFYAQTQTQGETSQEKIITLVEKISAVSSGDVKSVLDTLSVVVSMELSEGHIVNLGDLGRFRMSVRSKAVEKKEDFTKVNILRPRILFVPGAAMRNARKSATHQMTDLTRLEAKKKSSPNGGGGGSATPNPPSHPNE